mmetsp:Transcript_124581/g.398884  ORF Transcript_124581/g.398884 Transcript_124581/m.398884 type:complete len:89 (-) Transcript_124581:687-953(-)
MLGRDRWTKNTELRSSRRFDRLHVGTCNLDRWHLIPQIGSFLLGRSPVMTPAAILKMTTMKAVRQVILRGIASEHRRHPEIPLINPSW